jgi:hypothetical protein
VATVRFGLSVGQSLEQVADGAGSATAANNVELTIDQASTIVTDSGATRIISKNEVLLILEIFQQYLIRRNWP